MHVTVSPLNPRCEVRSAGYAELDQILREMVEPLWDDSLLSCELRAGIIGELRLAIDMVRIRLAMERVLEDCCNHVGAWRTGMAFGRISPGLLAHHRLRIEAARGA